jgi:hypothetical protein
MADVIRSILPVRREILLGVLYCDLIGFHTYDYARHFLSSCTRVLGLPTMPNGVEFEGRLAHVGTFPIGIDPGSFVDVGSLSSHSAFRLSDKLNLRRTCRGSRFRSGSKSLSAASRVSRSSLASTGSTTSRVSRRSCTRSSYSSRSTRSGSGASFSLSSRCPPVATSRSTRTCARR